MKLKSRYIILLLLPLFFATSCKDAVKEEYIIEIDHLSNTLEDYKASIDKYDSDKFEEIVESVNSTIQAIKSYYNSDTISYEIVEKINAYKNIPNAISINSGNLAKIKVAIPEVQIKLEELKHDVKNGVNERGKYQEYIDFEKDKVNEIGEVLEYFNKINLEYSSLYDSLHSDILNFQKELESNIHE